MIAFCRPRTVYSRLGDRRRIWFDLSRRYKIVEADTIGGVSLGVHFFAIRLLDDGSESLISRHRKRNAAMRAVARAANPRKKVRR